MPGQKGYDCTGTNGRKADTEIGASLSGNCCKHKSPGSESPSHPHGTPERCQSLVVIQVEHIKDLDFVRLVYSQLGDDFRFEDFLELPEAHRHKLGGE